MQYQTFTCPQLAEEAQRVSAAATAASGAQDTYQPQTSFSGS
jgi:hypothetical protein